MGKTLKDIKARNYLAVSAWGKNFAGSVKQKKNWKQNWREMAEEDMNWRRMTEDDVEDECGEEKEKKNGN